MSASRTMRDSTLGWLGLIPEAWELKPFFTVCSELNKKNKGMKESNLLSLSYGNIVLKDIDSNEGLLPESFEGYQIIEPNDLVFRFTDLQNDQRSLRSAISQHNGIITSAYLAVRPVGAIPRYLAYLMRAYDQLKVFYSMGGGLRQAMNFQDVKRLPLPIPPLDEQQVIVDFLDRETAQIDALIGKQQQLIETLLERRQAVVARAVTRGLNPKSTLVESGINWIGRVPEHWSAVPLRSLMNFRAERNSDYLVQDYLSLMANVGVIPYADKGDVGNKAPEDLSKCKIVHPGDFVLNSMNFGIGSFGVSQYLGVCSSVYIVLKPADHVSSPFLKHVFTMRPFQKHAQSLGNGILEHRAAIGWDDLKNLGFPLPPIAEQNEIASFLDNQTSQIDSLRRKAEEIITLLSERRQALISAAVTGKIDVRGN